MYFFWIDFGGCDVRNSFQELLHCFANYANITYDFFIQTNEFIIFKAVLL